MEKLKKKRGIVRSHLTKIINKIDTKLDDKNSIDELEECFEQLGLKETELKELDHEIENLTDENGIENETLASKEIREKIVSYKIRVKRSISKFKTTLSSNSINTNKSNEKSEISNTHVRLPKLEICKYDGKIENWLQFWSQYETAIHKNEQLSKIDKFNYLKMMVTGSALKSIQNLIVTETNYELAIKILTENYGRNDLVISSHMNKLLKLPRIRNSPNLYELRNFYEQCITHVRSLESLGVKLKSYENLLFPMIVQSIPEEILLNFNRASTKEADQWNVELLLQFFETEIRNRERVKMFKKHVDENTGKYDISIPNYGSRNNYQNIEMKKQNISAAALHSSTGKMCLFCSSDHESSQCSLSVPERKQKLMKQGRCFNCLKKQHIYRECRAKNHCLKCSRRHHTFICDNVNSKIKPDSQIETNAHSSNGQSTIETVVSSAAKQMNGNENEENVLLQTASVLLINNERNKEIRILLDNGSQKTFIDEKLSRSLNLKIVGREYLKIFSFGSKEPQGAWRKIVKVTLKSLCYPNKTITFDAVETPHICETIVYPPGENIRKYCSKFDLPIADFENDISKKPISILIGSDLYWKVCSGNIRRLSDTVVGMNTKFGYVFNGSEAYNNVLRCQNSLNVMKVVVRKENVEDETILKKMWDLESLGIFDNHEKDLNEEQSTTLKEFEKSIKFVGKRYEVKFPWNENKCELSNNLLVAEQRFRSLLNRFKKSPTFFEQYKNVIDDYLTLGIAEEVNALNSNTTSYYMPHQAVIRNDKSTKLRVVFDASSHVSNSFSLNDCIEPGPNLNPDLLGILVKFRLHKIAFTADIERAFLQIRLAPEERNFVRFLWTNDLCTSERPANWKHFRMTRVIFGATSSPFLLAATLKHHIKQFKDEYPRAFKILNECLYVDDLISGTDDENEAIETHQHVNNMLKKASFNMRKWQTNDTEIQENWNSLENHTHNSEDHIKVLGYKWYSGRDVIKIDPKGFYSKSHLKTENITKRDVIRLAGKFYDPVGFLTPFSVRIRILMQDSWKTGLNWDSPLPTELQNIYRIWSDELNSIEEFEIPRHYFKNTKKNKIDNYELHCFTDASLKAYGAVVYWRYETNGKFETNFIVSKIKVAPLKKITLPKLELMATIIGSRIISFVKQQLDFEIPCYFWSDSSIALHWIRSNATKFKPFVKNRINEIRKSTEPTSWSYCPTKENPADLLTRGEKIKSIIRNELWWHGPPWLRKDTKYWPKMEQLDIQDTDLELRRNVVETSIVSQVIASTNEICPSIFDLKKYSKLNRVLRITAWIQRFISNLKNKRDDRKSSPLTAKELIEAENFWIRETQNSFSEELKLLKDGKPLPQHSRLIQFDPFLDKDSMILKIGGRLQMSNLQLENKHPIILPANHTFTDLLIRNAHEKLGHSGIAETVTEIRERFWIIRIRQRVKNIIRNCNLCRKFSAKPMSQSTAPLPADRCREAHPFEITGIDFAGPLYVKNNKETKKAYILLFTCAVTRAVHLELTESLSTETFLLAFKKFISRRGLCSVLYSDNAKTFKAAKRELDILYDCLKKDKTQDFLSKNRIKWKFIVERAAWWGGFWERLIRSIKTCLKKILGKSSLTFPELEATLIETEAIINSRPITYVFSQPDEPDPLTPSHFLIGRRLFSLPHERGNVEQSRAALLRRYRHQQNLNEKLWNRWRSEYLSELQSKTNSKNVNNHLSEGQVVLIHEDKTPRLLWKIGVITAVHPGRDGKIRACTLRTRNGEIRRPVQLLYPMEVDSESNSLRTTANCPSGGGGCWKFL